jgi:periplasmic protein TonB
MLQGSVKPLLRHIGFVGIVSCAALLGPGAAQAGNMPAHVDSTQPNAEPLYPDSARAADEQGTVLIDVLVRSSGRPTKFHVAQSSGYGDLDAAAVQTVLNWRYVPAMRDGNTVSDWTTVKVVYQLPKTAAETPAPSAQ